MKYGLRGYFESCPLLPVACVSVAAHLSGLLFAAGWLWQGSALTSLSHRLAYLSTFPLAWTAGWIVWALAALTLVGYFGALLPWMPTPSPVGRLAFAAAAAGCGCDLVCDAVYIFVLPGVAAGPLSDSASFVAFERLAFAGGLVFANGLYTTAVALATLSFRASPLGTPIISGLGLLVTVFGSVMVVAGVLDSAKLAAVATGPTMLAYCGWTLAVASRTVEPRGCA